MQIVSWFPFFFLHLVEIRKYYPKETGYGPQNPVLRLLELILKKVRLVLLISTLALKTERK